jgi:hypothetical protein
MLLILLLSYTVKSQNPAAAKPKAKLAVTAASNSCVVSHLGEIPLETSQHVISTRVADDVRQRFESEMCASTTFTLDDLTDTIRYSELCALKWQASTLTPVDPCTNGYVTGLRITYGLEADKKTPILIYQPIKLCAKTYTQHSSTFTLTTFSVSATGLTYVANNYTLNQVSPTDVTDHKQRYASFIGIKHHTTSVSCEGFRNEDPTKGPYYGDITSVIFSFQEIEALAQRNDYPEQIKVWSGLVESTDPIHTGDLVIRKHDLILGPGNYNYFNKSITIPKFITNLLERNYSNRTHLCPPGCASVIYTVKTKH